MSNIYGGDEVNAIVLDVGTSLCKAGYGGDDIPKAIFPSSVGVRNADTNGMEVDGQASAKRELFVGQSAVNYRRDHMEITSPFNEEGLLSDWEATEGLWAHAFKERLRLNPAEYAVMMAEPSHNTREVREKMVELLFEKFGSPAMYIAKNAVLSAFATAKQTAVVVDSGHASTTVASVQDGYLLTKSVLRSPVGGQVLTRCMQAGVALKGGRIRPRYTFKRTEKSPGEFTVEELSFPHTTPGFHTYQVEQVAADIKESICRASDAAFDEAANSNVPTVSYELPDGQEIHVGTDRFKVPELLFQPNLLNTYPGIGMSAATKASATPLQNLVLDSISQCDVDVRKELYAGVVLTGGTSLISGLRDRLERELVSAGPQAAKIKVSMPINTLERRYSVWLGGSILSSLGSFQQMWMSKKEYEEAGAALIHRKAP